MTFGRAIESDPIAAATQSPSAEREAGVVGWVGGTDREQTTPAGHFFETFAKDASYMGRLREGWIEKLRECT